MKEKFLLQDMQEHLKLYYKFFYTVLLQCFVDGIFQIEIFLFYRLLVTLPKILILNCSKEFDERKTLDCFFIIFCGTLFHIIFCVSLTSKEEQTRKDFVYNFMKNSNTLCKMIARSLVLVLA